MSAPSDRALEILTITDTETLAAFCAPLHDAPFITVDTEFHRESTYWPKLCLVQVAGPETEALIDPLAEGLSLDPLLDLLGDETVLKVFHAARQDVEIFNKLMGKPPAPIFDSQVAAMACGYGDSVSYENLVRLTIKGRVDKSSRFTDWSRRPLTPKQAAYALADVTFLRDLYPGLLEKLETAGRVAWVEEEMQLLVDPATYDVSPERAWKRMKLRRKSPDYLAALAATAAWRERTAQDRNVPRGRILKDDAVQEIAEQRPLTSDAFDRLRATPKGFGRSRQGGDLIAALKVTLDNLRGKPVKDQEREKPAEPPGVGGDLLRVLLKHIAEAEGVAPRLIATTADLDRIAVEGECDVPALMGWRRDVFGEKALQLRAGKLSLSLNGKHLKIVSA